jgi:hypothetical protein
MRRLFWLLGVTLLALSALGPLAAAPAAAADPALDPAMVALWNKTDAPVANGTVDRSWLWGPQANHVLSEPYTYSKLPNNQRQVAYFDKSRMEINDPSGNPDDVWYVTNGRLVYELMTGRVQVGQDPDIYDSVLPAAIPVAGDPGSYITPTYQTLGRLMGSYGDHTGDLVTATLDASGAVGQDLTPPADVHEAYWFNSPGDGSMVGHNIPDVFWNYLTQQISPLVTPANWVFVTGYPLTEAYWTQAMVGGTQTDVLVQCFERRCLTYTPSNHDPYKVEMGNVGQHYYAWRYEHQQVTCSSTPTRGFGTLWTSNTDVRSQLGCPAYQSTQQQISTAYETFQNGMMVWIDVQDVYNPLHTVLVLYNDGTFARYNDTWTEDQPVDDPNITAPNGLFQPVRGFGKVWRETPGVRDRLGWATNAEQGSTGAYQRFDYGTMVQLDNTNQIYVFYGDLYWQSTGTWQVFPNSFGG